MRRENANSPHDEAQGWSTMLAEVQTRRPAARERLLAPFPPPARLGGHEKTIRGPIRTAFIHAIHHPRTPSHSQSKRTRAVPRADGSPRRSGTGLPQEARSAGRRVAGGAAGCERERQCSICGLRIYTGHPSLQRASLPAAGHAASSSEPVPNSGPSAPPSGSSLRGARLALTASLCLCLQNADAGADASMRSRTALSVRAPI